MCGNDVACLGFGEPKGFLPLHKIGLPKKRSSLPLTCLPFAIAPLKNEKLRLFEMNASRIQGCFQRKIARGASSDDLSEHSENSLSSHASLGLQGSKFHVYQNANDDLLHDNSGVAIMGKVGRVNGRKSFILDKNTYSDCEEGMQNKLANDLNIMLLPTLFQVKPKERPNMNQTKKKVRKSLRLVLICSTVTPTTQCSFRFNVLWCLQSKVWFIRLKNGQPDSRSDHSCAHRDVDDFFCALCKEDPDNSVSESNDPAPEDSSHHNKVRLQARKLSSLPIQQLSTYSLHLITRRALPQTAERALALPPKHKTSTTMGTFGTVMSAL